MPNLAIPDTGLQLETPANSPALAMQAFGVVLNDDVIEDMIRCFRDGENLELCLGNTPVSSVSRFCYPRPARLPPPLRWRLPQAWESEPGLPWSLDCLYSSP